MNKTDEGDAGNLRDFVQGDKIKADRDLTCHIRLRTREWDQSRMVCNNFSSES